MTSTLTFACETLRPGAPTLTRILTVTARQLVIAGWTGRDAAAIQHHIHELEQIGVPAPSSVPLYYRAANSLLTQSPEVQVLGSTSSGVHPRGRF